jgi:predicted DNA-binding protein (UPF0251 family)
MIQHERRGVERAGRRARGQRFVLAVAVSGTLLIGLGAFWLSFASLSALAQRCGIPAGRAWVWPLIVDGVIVVATVSVVAISGGGWERRAARYAWALLLAGACVSVAANASHALVSVHAGVPMALAALVASVPPVVLVAITHLTVELTGHHAPLRARSVAAASPATRRACPREPKRGDGQKAAGEAIRLRAQTSLSNREIAARLGVHPSTVGRWIKSERQLSAGVPARGARQQTSEKGAEE